MQQRTECRDNATSSPNRTEQGTPAALEDSYVSGMLCHTVVLNLAILGVTNPGNSGLGVTRQDSQKEIGGS
eukprot:1155506-Pelagomonas_calceolata.AAC.5